MTKESLERQVNLRILEQIKNNPGRGQEVDTTFEAFVADFRFTTTGDINLRLIAPYSERDRVLPLADAYGQTLTITVKTEGAKDA